MLLQLNLEGKIGHDLVILKYAPPPVVCKILDFWGGRYAQLRFLRGCQNFPPSSTVWGEGQKALFVYSGGPPPPSFSVRELIVREGDH